MSIFNSTEVVIKLNKTNNKEIKVKNKNNELYRKLFQKVKS